LATFVSCVCRSGNHVGGSGAGSGHRPVRVYGCDAESECDDRRSQRDGGGHYGFADTEPVLSAARANFNESSVRANVYFTFTLDANDGNELDLSTLTFNVAQGGGTALQRDYDIRSSLDNFATSLTGIVPIPTVRPTFTPVSVDLSAAQFQDLTSPITFQVRFFTPGVSQNVDFDDITVNGTVAAVPEPGALAMLAFGGACLLRRRRA
jgi:hypothetical protein